MVVSCYGSPRKLTQWTLCKKTGKDVKQLRTGPNWCPLSVSPHPAQGVWLKLCKQLPDITVSDGEDDGGARTDLAVLTHLLY